MSEQIHLSLVFYFSPPAFSRHISFCFACLFLDGKSGAVGLSFGIPLGASSESFPYKLIPLKPSPTELIFSNVSESPMWYDSLKKKKQLYLEAHKLNFFFPLILTRRRLKNFHPTK